MTTTSFKIPINITFIGTATAVLEINGSNFLTDPFFSPAGRMWDMGVAILKVSDDPGLQMNQLPPIDAVLLSHEDHPDNLDDFGRQLLDGRRVFTTQDGAKNLAPRPGVVGDTVYIEELKDIGNKFHVTVAIMNIGGAKGPGDIPLTIDGKDASRIFREIGADVLVPMHYDSWGHFTENGEALLKAFGQSGIVERVCWLELGKKIKVL